MLVKACKGLLRLQGVRSKLFVSTLGEIMSLAVKEIMSIYSSHSNLRPKILEALGEAGGDEAVQAIMSIYSNHSTLRPQVLKALGQAGGDQAVQAIMSIYNSHSTLRPQVLSALGQAGKRC